MARPGASPLSPNPSREGRRSAPHSGALRRPSSAGPTCGSTRARRAPRSTDVLVGGVAVNVLVVHDVAGPDHPGAAHLGDALAGPVDVMAALPRLDRGLPAPGLEHREKRHRLHISRAGRRRVVVDEHEVGNLLVVYEGGPCSVCRLYRWRRSTRPLALKSGSASRELRGVLVAVQSAEMAQEHQHHRPVGPLVAEPVMRTGVVGE